MKVIIVGAGLVGSQLARHLIQQKDDVVLIERSADTARHTSNRLDCMVLQEAGNRLDSLEEAGIAKADVLVCVTDSDEVNMVTCGLAASRYPKLLKIARVRNPDYSELGKFTSPILGIDRFVHPDVEAARAVVQAVEYGVLGDVWRFRDTNFVLGSMNIKANSDLAGRTVQEFRDRLGVECLICLIERNDRSLIPNGAVRLLAQDRIHVLAGDKALRVVFESVSETAGDLRRMAIVGGGRLGKLIAEGLIDPESKPKGPLSRIFRFFKPARQRQVIIVERDYAVCKDLSNRFPQALILNEDISDESFISEQGLEDLDLLITTTDNQELNIITALYLKSHGVKKTVALVNSNGYAAIARRLGIDVVVPTKSVVVDSILSQLLGGGVTGVHRVGEVEILEIVLGPGVPVLGHSLAAARFSELALVLLVTRNGEAFIPHGDYEFLVGDHLIVIVAKGGEAEIEKLFGDHP